jgi:hypothetical protein
MGVIFLQKYIAEVFMTLTTTNHNLEKNRNVSTSAGHTCIRHICSAVRNMEKRPTYNFRTLVWQLCRDVITWPIWHFTDTHRWRGSVMLAALFQVDQVFSAAPASMVHQFTKWPWFSAYVGRCPMVQRCSRGRWFDASQSGRIYALHRVGISRWQWASLGRAHSEHDSVIHKAAVVR